MSLVSWIKGEVKIFVTWAQPEIQKVETLLSAFLQDIEPILKQDIIAIIANGIPVVIQALGSNPVGNLNIGIAAAENYLIPALRAEGITLFQTTENILVNILAARAQIAVGVVKTVPTVAGALSTAPLPGTQAVPAAAQVTALPGTNAGSVS